MSDDDFFQDKGSSSLQYIKCKTSTKIDDILKRRKNKLINEENDKRSQNEASSPQYNPTVRNEKEEHTEGSRRGNDEGYFELEEKSDNEERRSSYQLEDVNKYLIRHSDANMLDEDRELKLGRNYTQDRYSLGKKSFTKDSIKDIFSYDEKLKKGNIKSCINLSTFDDTKRSPLGASKLLEHLNVEGKEKSSSPYHQHNGEEGNVGYGEDILGGNLKNIYKTPSTEVLLREIRSKGDEDGRILHDGEDVEGEFHKGYDENKEEIFANLNKMYLNDVDLNKTPSKSFSKSYFDYLKFETAGKMNMSELETPANLKEDKDEEGTNTPFITYYLAGKTSKNGLEQEGNVHYPCDDEKGGVVHPGAEAEKGSGSYLPPSENPQIIEDLISKGEQDKKRDSHFVTEEEVSAVSHLDKFKSMVSNQGDDTKYRRSYNGGGGGGGGGGESGTLLKASTSQKYNFVKTKEEYNEIMRGKYGRDEIGKGSATTTGRIAENRGVNFLGNFVSNNNVSFNDNIFCSNQFHIINTKSFRENLFAESKQCDRERTMPLQMMKHVSDALPHGCDLGRSLMLRDMSLANSIMEKPGVHEVSFGEGALHRGGDYQYASPWNGKVDTHDDRPFDVSKNNLVVNSMMLQRSQTGINQIDQFAIHRSASFGDIKKSTSLVNKFDKDPHTDVYVREYSTGVDNPPVRFNSLKRSTVNLASHEEENHSRWSKSEHNINAGDHTEVSKNVNYNNERSYNTMKEMDSEEGTIIRGSDLSNAKNGIIFTKLSNLHKHSDDERDVLHNTSKYSIEGREKKKNFSNSSEHVYLRSSHYNDVGERRPNYANAVKKKKNITVDIGGVNKHTYDGVVGFVDINKSHELPSFFEKAHMGNCEEGSVMHRSVASKHANAIIPADGMTNAHMDEGNGMSFYNGSFVGRELLPVGSKSGLNKLGETADFGGKESSDFSESRNTDNTVRIISGEGYVSDRRREVMDGRDLRQYWFDYINSSFGSVNANDIRGLIFGSSQGRIDSSAANKHFGPISHQTQHSACAVPGDVSTNRINEDVLAELIREKIKDSINDVVERLLSRRGNTDIDSKDVLGEVEREPNLSHASKRDQGGIDEDVAPVEGGAGELREKNSTLICNNGVNQTIGKQYGDEVQSSQGSQHMGREPNKETVMLDEEDVNEIEKLNNHLKLNKIKKKIKLPKEDKEKNQVKWKNVLYNCIDIIYLLTNENNAKNKKMNSLLGEINKLNEYEKKIENLNEENEKLKIEVLQKNELVKKKDIKERTNLNLKIAEQGKKIANYEKDINIYKNKVNKLNHKISSKDSELDKLKKQYQVVLDEIDKCKQDAAATVKQVLNKKHTTLVDKQCLDISKHYEVEMCMLNKEIRNLKDLLKNLNKTPSKSFSKSYFDYLKFETAGKMNMSELETPANLKEDKDEEGTNTPFITYYLAGKTSKNGLEQEGNVHYPCDDEKGGVVHPGAEAEKGSGSYLPPSENPQIIEDLISKGEQDKKRDSHFVTEEEVSAVSHLDKFKSMVSNQGDDTKYRRSYNGGGGGGGGGGESGTLLKASTSQKYNFVKTKEEYNEIMRGKYGRDEIGKGSATTTGRIAENRGVNFLGNFVSNNNVSFNDNIFCSNQFHIINTKSFRENLFAESKQCDRERTMPLQMMKHVSDALPHGCDLGRSLMLRDMSLANSIMEKPGVHEVSFGEGALHRGGDYQYASPWNGKVDTHDDRPFDVSKNNLVVNSMMLQRSQTGINQIDQFAIHRSASFGDIKKSTSLVNKFDKDPHTDVYVREYSTGVDNPPVRFNSLKRSTVNLASHEEENHSRWSKSEHNINAGDHTEVSKNVNYNNERSYNTMKEMDSEEGTIIRGSDLSNAKNGIIFTKLSNLHKHSDDERDVLHNTSKYSIEGREKKKKLLQ
ncbi:hypothetical protein AK88_02601 [Plasmodium fragile]|uniref:Uncharacterized protein n=1 Tax=Plasmodium fragile TaxID=5857 RepID=A0A0D9QPU3_PLAFR|nr:uncharacterized protein AK88_02601 [Plasmodium fragile]KJP87706.1 hypothetical protein AK88_02601 [Plasmodium fragile]